ncbi:AarF/ABC1/UbiB kinase family protein [bacterium]|nr:AarF/ABC1/UbiB kinase family protein [bacterium]
MPSFIFEPVLLFSRYQRLLWCLYRYGVAGGLASLGFECGKRGVLWIAPKSAKKVEFDSVFGKNLARTFQEMGPTFIKLGQVLATRPDIVGEGVAKELEVLYSGVRTISLKEVKKILVRELGKKKVNGEILSIEETPLGSASIGQCHRATLKDGSSVVIKIQKPGVSDLIRLDLKLLEWFVKPAAAAFPKLGLNEMYQDFKESTFREIDYRQEAKNIDQFKKNFRRVLTGSNVVFPKYYPKLSTSKVIVLEPMRGKPISDLEKGTRSAKQAAFKGLSAVLEQIFEHGFFHADPHSANVFFVEEEGRMGFIDMGLVGQLEEKDKRLFLKVLMSIIKRDRKLVAQSLFQLGTPGKATKYDKFEKEIEALLEQVKSEGLENVKLDQMVTKLMAIARRNQIYIPNRYVMMIRSCLIIEGVAKSLDPDVSVLKVAVPVVAKGLLKSYNPLKKLM